MYLCVRNRTSDFLKKRSEHVAKRGVRMHVKKPGKFNYGDEDDAPLINADDDVEMQIAKKDTLPPEWMESVDKVRELMATAAGKMKELAVLHNKPFLKMDFDDDSGVEERQIEIVTLQISSLFNQAKNGINSIGAQAPNTSTQVKVTQNIKKSLTKELLEISGDFKKSQSTYLRKLEARDKKTGTFSTALGSGYEGLSSDAMDENPMDFSAFSDAQKQAVKENQAIIQQRDEQILNIVKSIEELSTIFKDLATLVVDQGMVMDRIDYNMEIVVENLKAGQKKLQEADKEQKSAGKKYIILLLVVVVVALIFAVIFGKNVSKKR